MRERRLAALSPDGRLYVETSLRADAADPIAVRMRTASAVTGRLVDEEGKAVAGASPWVMYPSDDVDAARIPLSRVAVTTDADGRFRVAGIFPEHVATIEFHRASKQFMNNGIDRPESLRKLLLEEGRTREEGNVTTTSLRW